MDIVMTKPLRVDIVAAINYCMKDLFDFMWNEYDTKHMSDGEQARFDARLAALRRRLD